MLIVKNYLLKGVIVDNNDMVLYNKWKDDPSKENFQTLYKHFKPVLRKAIQKASYTSTVPEAAFKLRAAQQFYDSIQNYDPTKGAKLHSRVFGDVQEKVKRLNYTYGNIVRQPERSGGELGVYHFTKFQNAKEMLREKLGREPSAVELAEKMKVSVQNIERYEQEQVKNLSLNDELENLTSFTDVSAEEAEWAMRYYDMSPEQQVIFDYATGEHGKPRLNKPNGKIDWPAISRATGMSEQKVQRLWKKLAKSKEY